MTPTPAQQQLQRDALACFHEAFTLEDVESLVAHALLEGEATVCLWMIAETLAWARRQAPAEEPTP